MTIFLDKPEETPPEKCRCEVFISIQGEAKPEGEVKIREIPQTDIGSVTHRGPTKNIQNLLVLDIKPEEVRHINLEQARRSGQRRNDSIQEHPSPDEEKLRSGSMIHVCFTLPFCHAIAKCI